MNKKVLDQLAGALGIDVEVLTKGISSEQEDATIELPKGTFLSEADLATLKDNHGKERYDAGATASREILLKDLADEAGIERSKDKSSFLKSYKTKLIEEANVEPDKKVSELQASLENLQKQLTDGDKKYSDLQKDVSTRETRFKIQSMLPDLPEGSGLSKEEAVDIYLKNREVKEDGIYKAGNLMKDNLERALTLDKDIEGFVTERGWNVIPTGRGGGAGKPTPNGSGISTMEEYENHLKDRGLSVGGQEANAILAKAMNDNPDNFN